MDSLVLSGEGERSGTSSRGFGKKRMFTCVKIKVKMRISQLEMEIIIGAPVSHVRHVAKRPEKARKKIYA
jgi:hypothetical protein